MTTADFRIQQAEIREDYDRMAGLVVAFICSIATASMALIAWGLL